MTTVEHVISDTAGERMVAPTRPILRYHGGKWRMAPSIIQHFPPHRGYVEPYAGSASILLRKPRSHSETINDLDGNIVNLFRVLRDRHRAKELEHLLRLTPYSRDEFKACAEAAEMDHVERARRFMVRQWQAYSGRMSNSASWRANSLKSGTPASSDWANLPDQFSAVVSRLQGVAIENKPALEVICQYDTHDTLIYCDPPYVPSTRTSVRSEVADVYTYEMTVIDHKEMASVLRACVGMVILSGYDCALYQELFSDWKRIEFPVMANGQKGGSVERTESLWLNAAASRARHNLFTEAA